MGKIYKRKCNYCKKPYLGEGKYFCSPKCRNKYRARYQPKWRKKLSLAQLKRWTPKRKKKQSEIHKKIKKRYKFTKTDILKGAFQKGNIPWNKGLKRNNRVKKAISKANKGRLKGKKNPQWQGGISKNPYDSGLTPYKKHLIFKRDNFECQICHQIGGKLSIHHIDYNKQNSNKNNLITLCQKCNCKCNFNRKYWKEKLCELVVL
jgi:hypothetical protein